MDRKAFLKTAGAAITSTLLSRTTQAETPDDNSKKNLPNVLMITCHDIGRHIGCYGVETVQTKNLDRLAKKGVRFARCYSTSAVCSPGRGSLHTGRYPQSNGLMGLTHAPWWWGLNEGEKHTAAILSDLGYATYLIGLNHLGQDPYRLGYGTVLSERRDAGETVQATKELIRRAEIGDRPFFAKVGFTEVHRPFTHGAYTERGVFVPPWLEDTPAMRNDLAAFQGTIKYFDERVGEVIDALEASEIASDTLVIMTSDHGIPYPGAKWTIRKAGFEIPLIMYKPGSSLSGGRVVSELMSNVDVLPTLLDFLGAEAPAGVQGRSFKDLLDGTAKEGPRREVFGQYTSDMKRDNLSRSILTRQYHLIRYFEAGRAVIYPADVDPQAFAAHVERCKTSGTRPFVQLFDIEKDPYELDDLGSKDENTAIVADLSGRLLAWMKTVDDPLLDGPVHMPYYERAMKDFIGNRPAR